MMYSPVVQIYSPVLNSGSKFVIVLKPNMNEKLKEKKKNIGIDINTKLIYIYFFPGGTSSVTEATRGSSF